MNDVVNHIRGFLERYRVAKNGNSKELRLTINEAEQLAAALAVMLSKQTELQAKVIDLQETLISAEIKQDGGSF